MKFLAGLITFALLLAGAAPALAGGYWDAEPAPPPQYAEAPPCHQGCPPPPPRCGCWRDREMVIRREEAPLPPPPPPSLGLPAEFFDTEGSVGPAYLDYGYEGGGGVVFEQASASAFASSSAHVSVNVRIFQHMRQHMMMHHPAPHGCGCGGHHW